MTLREAIKKWDREVEEVAEQLIENGVPPYEAQIRAVEIVSERRKNKEDVHPKPI